MRDTFENWFATSTMTATDRLTLFKMSWNLIGSEFSGRHMLHEKFYAGNSLIVKNQSDHEAPWE